jgi:RNA polymerase subunit RPABC4/transcription elongation factor Spt4
MDKGFLKRLVAYYLAFLVLLLGLAVYGYFAGMTVLPSGELPGLLLLGVVTSIVFFFIFALIGIGYYVYHDAELRGMNPLLWTLISVFAPYFVGLIVYVVIRSPLPARCPACGAISPKESAFCPKCGKPIRRQCPTCHATLDQGYRFCPACGAAIEMPQA